MKKIVSIQDISCIGKCSLTVALPIISAMGIETAILPTAVLSTHTAFKGFTFRDLTDDIDKISSHWKNEKFSFDAIYTGYLGSYEQINLVSDFFKDYKTDDNVIVVDPAMGDYGKLYTGFTPEFAKKMGTLAGKADVILPNMTEASFMLGIPYVDSGYDEIYVQNVLKKLCGLGCKKAVLTGISFDPQKLGTYSYDSVADKFFYYYQDKINKSYHGTGDVFASTFVGALMNGSSFEDSQKIAVDYTVECIKDTINDPKGNWYGVNFETAIPFLIKRIGK